MRPSLRDKFSALTCGLLLGVVGCSTPTAPAPSAEAGIGGRVTLTWNAPTANTNGTPLHDVAGYIIEYGPDSWLLVRSVRIPNPTANTYTMQDLTPGIWYFAVRAITSAGVQGARSRVVHIKVKSERGR